MASWTKWIAVLSVLVWTQSSIAQTQPVLNPLAIDFVAEGDLATVPAPVLAHPPIPSGAIQFTNQETAPVRTVAVETVEFVRTSPERHTDAATQQDHIARAIQHLQAAGLPAEAEALAQRAQRMAQSAELQRKTRQLTELQQEIAALRTKLGVESQYILHMKIYEFESKAFDQAFGAGNLPQSKQVEVASWNPGTPGIQQSTVIQPTSSLLSKLAKMCREGRGRVLAEPSMVVCEGRPATMHSGGEFPISVPASDGTTSIEFREFGTKIEAVVQSAGQGELRIELNPEVSELDYENAVKIGGTTVPGLRIRRLNTQLQLETGETAMLVNSSTPGKSTIMVVSVEPYKAAQPVH